MKMDEKNEGGEKIDEVLLPGFRFHPTDEELVGFYLKKKIQQRPLSIDLIKQLDIYKYDPWDLPKLASTGEKEWYFFCPRDRKYRNSARPNRVTKAGFWKATGTDRPIYSSHGNKCIGLKKSLVFYKGKAAKGVKTDWMMHEFRLPSLGDPPPSRRCATKNFPAISDSWAICRIFKKTNPITPRTLSQSWVSPCFPNPSSSNHTLNSNYSHITPGNLINTSAVSPMQHRSSKNNICELDAILQSPNTFSSLDIPTFNTYPNTENKSSTESSSHNYHECNFSNFPTSNLDLPPSFILPQLEDPSESSKTNDDLSSILLNMSSSFLGGSLNKPCDENINFDVHPNNHVQCHDSSPSMLSNDYQDYQSALMGDLHNLVHLQGGNNDHQLSGSQSFASIFPLSSLMPFVWDCPAPLS